MSQQPSDNQHWSRLFLVKLSAHWVRGALYISAILVAWYFLKPIVPALMQLTGNRNAAVTFVLFALFGPLVIGWVGQKLISPLIRRIFSLDGAAKLEDRLVREFAADSNRGFPVVVVPWPSPDVRSLALMTDIYDQPEGGGRLVSVYIPGTPDPSSGHLRVVREECIRYTKWSMKDLLQHQATYGTTGPERLVPVRPDTREE